MDLNLSILFCEAVCLIQSLLGCGDWSMKVTSNENLMKFLIDFFRLVNHQTNSS